MVQEKGKYSADGSSNAMPGSNIPMAALGAWILWLGWFGFNGGSELVVSSEASAIAVSQVFLNTNMAAAGGVVGALLMSLILTGKMDVTMAINGAIAGLVAITAGPSAPTAGAAVLIGLIGGIIVYYSILFFEQRLKIDDPVGAISAHGIVGIFWSNGSSIHKFRCKLLMAALWCYRDRRIYLHSKSWCYLCDKFIYANKSN